MCLRQNNVVSEVYNLLFETYVHLNKLYAISDIECGCLWSFLLIKKNKKEGRLWLFVWTRSHVVILTLQGFNTYLLQF